MIDGSRFVILSIVLIAAAVWDVRTQRAPNWLTLGGVLLGFVLALVIGVGRTLAGEPASVIGSEMGAAGLGFLMGFVPMAIIFFSGAMGGADVKTMAAAGAISASWPIALETFINAFVVAAIMGIFIMIRHGLIKRTFERIFGAVLVALARSRPQIKNDSPQVPFLVAVAIGGILAGGRHLMGLPLPWGFDT